MRSFITFKNNNNKDDKTRITYIIQQIINFFYDTFRRRCSYSIWSDIHNRIASYHTIKRHVTSSRYNQTIKSSRSYKNLITGWAYSSVVNSGAFVKRI